MHDLTDHRKTITLFLNQFFHKKRRNLQDVWWSKPVLEQLQKFATSGKLLRGGLTLFSYEMFGGTSFKEALKMAAALEISQSAILIHDDIVDRDDLRRSEKSIHKEYQEKGTQLKFENPSHYGNSMGIFVGDIGFFLGMELINELLCTNTYKQQLIKTYSQEMQYVGFAQMQDTHYGKMRIEPTEEEIIKLYKRKTGRYTFGLPLLLGAQLTYKKTTAKLMQLGELLGVMYQLTDDTLSLFGEVNQTGKPIGTDIIRNNKTLHRLYLLHSATLDEVKKAKTIFGNVKANTADIAYIKQLMEQYKISGRISIKIKETQIEAITLINSLNVPNKYKKILKELVVYCNNRTR